MKKSFAFIWIIVFFLACEDQSHDYGLDRYYVEIVTALEENVFQLDNGETLFNTSKLETAYNQGQRILLNYTLLGEKTSGFDHTIRVNGASSITSGSLKAIPQEEVQALKNEPIRLESIWIGSHFLNMQFYMNFHSKPHSVALVVYESSLNKDPLELYFKHNSNDDPAGSPVHLYSSFDLKEILGSPQRNKPIRIFVSTSNYGEKIYDLVY